MIWGAVAGGFAGTLVLTTVLRAASEMSFTRIDLPFLLGTALTTDRNRAKALGYLLHFVLGQLFAICYLGMFVVIGHSGWILGAVLGLAHGLFSITALVNVLLPVVHPRMGSTYTAAGCSPLLEPPGFMLRNYGARTPAVTIAAHVAYGALVGELIALAT